MNEDASEGEIKTFKRFQNEFQEMMDGKRNGMIFPAVTDSDGNYLFDLQYVGPDNVTVINNYNVKD